MSMCYWLIEGIGIDVEKIVPFLDKKDLAHFLLEQLPDDEELSSIVNDGRYEGMDYEEFTGGNPFENLADMLTHCDDTDSLTFGDDGDGGLYFYYPPSMPWQRTKNEPDSVDEVHRRIIKAVKKITSLLDSEIEEMIDDDLYVVGMG